MAKKNYRAELYIGRVKATKHQKKKHVLQMSEQEVHYLKKEIRLFPTWKLKESKHLKSKPVSYEKCDILNTLALRNVEDYILEYNVTFSKDGKDRRILLGCPQKRLVTFRTYNRKKVQEYAYLYFVISLETYEIVTVYWNKVDDTHENRDWLRYSDKLQIIPKNKQELAG